MTRRPERRLEVLWQRHIPAGVGIPAPAAPADRYAIRLNDVRVDAVADLTIEVEKALEEFADEALDEGDLVVTISRRPLHDD